MSRYRGSERFCRYTVSPLRKRKFEPSVEGQGALVAMPAEFFGNEYVDGTGIVFDGLEFSDTPDGKQAPFSYRVWPQIRVAGTRRFSALPINPKIHCHIVYELRNGVGDLIAYDTADANLNPWTGALDSPYDDYGNVAMFLNRDAGSYRLTVKAYLATSNSTVARMASFVYDYTVAQHTGTWLYHDSVTGNAANDRLDPNGFGLTNASYVEATGILTETGKFTGYTLTTEADLLNSNRWIYINGYGRIAIKQIIDANSIELEPDYKLGADATGLTSSTGPGTAGEFATEILTTPSSNNKMLFISGMNSDSYNSTQMLRIQNFNGSTGVVGYGGKPTMLATANHTVVSVYGSSSQGSHFDHAIVSNIIIDGNELGTAFSGLMGSNTATDTHTIALDHVEIIRSRSPSAISVQQSGTAPTHTHIFNGNGNNQRTNVEVLAPSGALTAGDLTIQVSAPIPTNVAQNALIKITEGSVTEYKRSASWTGDTFTLGVYRETQTTGLVNSFTTAATITVSDEKSVAVYPSCKGIGVRGLVTLADADMPTYDHHYYPNMKGSNNYFCYTIAKAASERIGYHFNMNNDTGGNLDNLNCSRNLTEVDAAEWFSDMSTENNTAAQGTMTSMYYHNNVVSPIKGAFYGHTCVEVFFKQNRATTTRIIDNGMFTVNEGSTDELWPNYDWDWVIHNNESVGYRPMNTQNSSESPSLFQQGNFEYIGNTSEYYGTTARPVNIGKVNDYANLGVLVFRDNNIWAPNYVGDLFRVDGVTYSLEAFNTLVGGTNTTNSPETRLNFDPAVPIYATTVNSVGGISQVMTGQKIKINFNSSVLGTSKILTDGPQGDSVARCRLNFTGLDQLSIDVGQWSSITIDGNTVTNGSDISAYLDGVDHTIIGVAGIDMRLGTVGLNISGTNGWSGQLWGLQILNSSDVVTHEFLMNEVKLNGETEADTVGAWTMTYVNTDAGDWS